MEEKMARGAGGGTIIRGRDRGNEGGDIRSARQQATYKKL